MRSVTKMMAAAGALLLSGCTLSAGGYFPSDVEESGTELSIGMRASPYYDGPNGSFGWSGELRFEDVGNVSSTTMHATGLIPVTSPLYLLGGVGWGSDQISWTGELGGGAEFALRQADAYYGLFLEGGWRILNFAEDEDGLTPDPYRGPFVRAGITFCFGLLPC